MPAKPNGFWDFKSYTERTWFRDLIFIFVLVAASYVALHAICDSAASNYEYTKLSPDQLQFINRIYLVQPAESAGITATTTTTAAAKNAQDTCSSNTCRAEQTALYLHTLFEGKLDKGQEAEDSVLLLHLNGEQASSFLSGERFRIHSYFWLIGPAVYWELVFWSLFGVLCNLLFILGAVGSNATTDLTNPQSQFDSSEILGQVAKILYAPLCVLVVILGYNFFNNQNVVDIGSGKGLLVFAFIGGFYSSRVIALMDRLKDVLLPNSGTSSLQDINQNTNAPVNGLKVQLALGDGVSTDVSSAAAGNSLNGASVQLSGGNLSEPQNGVVNAGDPPGLYTFQDVPQGNYLISAKLRITTNDGDQAVLSGSKTGQIISGTAPIPILLN